MQPGLMMFAPDARQQMITDPSNMTNVDLSSVLGDLVSPGGLNIQFFYQRVKIECADPALNGTYQTRLCIAKQPKGERMTIATTYITEEQAMRQFPREFAYFKEYEAAPTSGTPLMELPGISQSGIALMTIHGIRSIEDLAALPQESVSAMGLDAMQSHRVAVAWLRRKTESADVIEAGKAEAARIASETVMQRQLEDLARQNAELSAQVKLLLSGFAGPQAQPQAASGPVNAQGGTFIDRAGDDLPERVEDLPALFTGGVASGVEDLNDPDPLSLR